MSQAASAGPPPPLPPKPSKTAGLAVASLALSCASLVAGPFGFIPGIICGHMARKRIRDDPSLGGKGLATAGLAVGYACLAVSVAALLLVVSIFAVKVKPALQTSPQEPGKPAPSIASALVKGQDRAHQVVCKNNLKVLGIAVRIYATDHNDLYPPAAQWCDAIQDVVRNDRNFQCPAVPNQRCAYAFNQKLGGLSELKINPKTVMLFESDAGWNGAGDESILIKTPRHNGVIFVCYANSEVEAVPTAELDQLRWEP